MATNAGISAFKEAYLDADTLDQTDLSDWSDFGARKLRYQLLWAYFQGNAYRDIHTWAKKMRADFGLYKYTRDIYNPAYQLGSFYQTYVWGGSLDDDASAGTSENPGALPIITENEDLRPTIAQIWGWSNWKTKRKLVPLYGSVLGDVFIQVVDDTSREKVYLKIVHPGIVKDVTLDPFGNVKGYAIEYERTDPEGDGRRDATYLEIVERDGDFVVYSQFKNGKPYDWDFNPQSANGELGPQPIRSIEYGFVPMVFIPHRDVGLVWGVAESFNKLAVFREVDDQASKLNDQVRKIVDTPWLFAGVGKPESSLTTAGAASSTTRPEPGREEVPAIYSSNVDAKAHALVPPLAIGEVSENIQKMLNQLEKAYPELALYRVREGSDLSGRAIRLIQRDTESKVVDYRDVYDGALVRAHQMAIAIAGMRSYEGFNDLSLDSFASGALNHKIGSRPVFAKDPMDDLELEEQRLNNQKLAIDAGYPLDVYMKSVGHPEDLIQEIINSPDYQARLATLQSLTLAGEQGG